MLIAPVLFPAVHATQGSAGEVQPVQAPQSSTEAWHIWDTSGLFVADHLAQALADVALLVAAQSLLC